MFFSLENIKNEYRILIKSTVHVIKAGVCCGAEVWTYYRQCKDGYNSTLGKSMKYTVCICVKRFYMGLMEEEVSDQIQM